MTKIQISKGFNIILFLLITLLLVMKFNLYNFTFLNKNTIYVDGFVTSFNEATLETDKVFEFYRGRSQ